MTVNEAVRAFRGEATQQRFSTALGISISAWQNYEGGKTPDTNTLALLADAAMAEGRTEIADVFLAAFRQAIDPVKARGIDVRQSPHVENSYEYLAVATLLKALRGWGPEGHPDATWKLVRALTAVMDAEDAKWFRHELEIRGIRAEFTASRTKIKGEIKK